MLAPLRFGAGIKVVRSDAVWNASITTSIGAESMHGDLVGMVLTDNSAVLQMKRYYIKMKDFGFKLKKNGVDIINHRYLRGLFEDDFMEKIKWLQANKNIV
jgi:hypothetical protein